MNNFSDMLSKAKKMQDQMKEVQENIKKIEVEGIAGGNLVKVILKGDYEMKSITISSDAKNEKSEIIKKLLDRSTLSVKELAKNLDVDRSNYYLVQPPQTFDNNLLKEAYKQPYNIRFTDDASVVASDGHEVHLIEGSYKNIKITTDGDLHLAQLFLSKNLV